MNGDRPLIIAITTDVAAWSWLIPAHGRTVLLTERHVPTDGKIDLIDPHADCTVYDSVDLPMESFTITPEQVGDAPVDFAISITAGAPIQAPVNVDYFGGCSG